MLRAGTSAHALPASREAATRPQAQRRAALGIDIEETLVKDAGGTPRE
jgi:hypothetical protein